MPLIMGILNCTPDSFSDGGCFNSIDKALNHSRQMLAEGVDLIDIGGESSKPGALPISAKDEIARVIPIIKVIREESDIAISIDTTKAEVMKAAFEVGASMINDISALNTPETLELAANLQVPICLMHMKGKPQTMQINPQYEQGVIDEINHFFALKINQCLDAGIDFANLILDPGFGFGKTVEQNMRVIKELNQFHKHKLPLMLGVSRKSTIGALLQKPVNERLVGGITIAAYAAMKDVAIIRTHDVAETKQTFRMLEAINGTSENKAGARQ